MKIDPAITSRIRDLGGNTPLNYEFIQEFLLGTTFPHYLYDDDWQCYGVDEFLDKNRSVFDNDIDEFLNLIEQHYFTQHDFACGQDFWHPTLFTPLTPGTADFDEWQVLFTNEFDLSLVRDLCGDGLLEFVQIIDSYGYPDHYYICNQDPTPENPTVFGTDHETYFREVSLRGTLLEFLNLYCTRNDFRQIVRKYVAINN